MVLQKTKLLSILTYIGQLAQCQELHSVFMTLDFSSEINRFISVWKLPSVLPSNFLNIFHQVHQMIPPKSVSLMFSIIGNWPYLRQTFKNNSVELGKKSSSLSSFIKTFITYCLNQNLSQHISMNRGLNQFSPIKRILKIIIW